MLFRSRFPVAVAWCVACAPSPSPRPPQPVPTRAPVEEPSATVTRFQYPESFRSRYAVEHRDSTIVAGVEGAPQIQSLVRTMFVTVEAGEPRANITITLDSVRLDPAEEGAGDPPQLGGTTWRGGWAPTGLVGPLIADQPPPITQELGGILRLLFPLLPNGGISIPGNWRDTTAFDHRAGTFDVRDSVRTVYRVLPVAGDAELVEGEAVFIRNGDGIQGGQALRLSGIGLRSTRYNFSTSGVLTTGIGTDSLSLTVETPTGAAVPVRQFGWVRIRRIP